MPLARWQSGDQSGVSPPSIPRKGEVGVYRSRVLLIRLATEFPEALGEAALFCRVQGRAAAASAVPASLQAFCKRGVTLWQLRALKQPQK